MKVSITTEQGAYSSKNEAIYHHTKKRILDQLAKLQNHPQFCMFQTKECGFQPLKQ